MTGDILSNDKLNVGELLAAAEKIGRLAEAEAVEAERNSTLSKNVIDAIEDANIPRLFMPKRYGGLGVDLRTYSKMIRTVAKYSPAAAWLTYFFSIHKVWASYLPPKGREEIFNHGGLLADVFAPVGTVTKEGDHFRLSGKWNFASGVIYSDWIALGAIMQYSENGLPEYCMLTLPISDVEIVENWDSFGMRATGSHGVIVDGALVPEHRIVRLTAATTTGKPLDDEYDKEDFVYQAPLLTLFYIGFPLVALGGTERLLSEFKTRTEKRFRVFEMGALEKESARSQRVLAELKTQFAGAEGLMDRYISMLEEYQKDSQENLTNEGPEHFFALRAQTIKICSDIAVKVLLTLGGTAIYKGDPVEQFTRDILTVATHPTSLYEDALASYGKSLFGFKDLITKY